MNLPTHDPGNARPCARPDLASELIRWDELEFRRRLELESHASECASCGPALALLRRAEAWLDSQGRAAAVEFTAGDCPDSEDLYDFGQGPGARALSVERRKSIEAHLIACGDCRALVATLVSRPPVPMILDGASDEHVAAPRVRETPRAERIAPRRMRRWIPLAAAAALLVTASLLWREIRVGAAVRPGIFPVEDVLRGVDASPLEFPRERVLRVGDRLWSAVEFELAPRERASSYRIQVAGVDGGAFDQGKQLSVIETPTPRAKITDELAKALTPGRFTWEAWAIVDGLDVFLGRRDFEVVEDSLLAQQLGEAARLAGDERAARTLQLLDEKGLATDERAFARGLPQSAERDAFLARVPRR